MTADRHLAVPDTTTNGRDLAATRLDDFPAGFLTQPVD
jgi:hypothetical protein